jgi:predicted house-cleaning noncanonical NTP pyrophosphatase (MazG superfamily)
MDRKDIRQSPEEFKEYLEGKVGEESAVAIVVLTAILAAAIAAQIKVNKDKKKKKGK